MNKKTIIITVIIVIIIAVAAWFIFGKKGFFWKTEETADKNGKIINESKDEHGCVDTAGYTWCESKQKCLKKWEEDCPEAGKMTFDQALEIAKKSECAEKGGLTDKYVYNSNTKTWWIDLDMKEQFKRDYCYPACVVNEETNTAEINWRCTGLTK